MKNILIVPDSFKGTMSSFEVCSVIEDVIKDINEDINVISLPVADGGEGSLEAIEYSLQYPREHLSVVGPNGSPYQSFYLFNGDIAVIGAYTAAGLSLAKAGSSPISTTTYGVGELIVDAVNKGAKEIILTVGGLSTNDAGCGILSALGIKFFDRGGKQFIPTGGSLINIDKVEYKEAIEKYKDIKIKILSDVDNPFIGIDGASYTFAAQKGASEDEIELLEEGMTHFVKIIKQYFNKDISYYPSSGAAGGIVGGLLAFFNDVEVLSGIETILEINHIDEKLKNIDLIITGEGKLDNQSLHGKVISGVAEKAKEFNIPIIAFVGKNILDNSTILDMGLKEVFEINPNETDLEMMKLSAKRDLRIAAEEKLIKYV